MRITINVEIDESEVDLVTELLSTLRSFTDHVHIRNAPAAKGHPVRGSAANGHVTDAGKAPLPTPQQSVDGRITTPGQSQSIPMQQYPPRATPLALPPSQPHAEQQQKSVHLQPQQQSVPSQRAAAHPADTAPSHSSSGPPPGPQLTRQSIVQALRSLMMQLDTTPENYHETFDKVAGQLGAILQGGNLGTEKEAFDQFFEAFLSILFDANLVDKNKSIVSYMNLLPRLPEPFLGMVRDPLIQKVVKHLTLARPPDANRADFILQAEAFACLVSLDFVGVQGAVNTLWTLLRDERKRCAAVTMLGKTAELCAEQLKAECPPEELEKLRQALGALTQPAFEYDRVYIAECLGWPLPATTPSAGGGSSQRPSAAAWKTRLGPGSSMEGHQASVFALAWDARHCQLTSSSKDGKLILWDARGRQLQSLDAREGYYYNGLAHAEAEGLLAAVGMGAASSPGQVPCIEAFAASQGRLERRAHALRPAAAIISSLAFLPGSAATFVAGESHDGASVVALYDAHALSREGHAHPVTSYKGSQDMVTMVACMGGVGGQLVLSGARDGTIALYDTRSSAQAATFAAGAMVTTLDTQEHYVYAGNLKGDLSRWDLRAARAENSAAIAPAQTACVDGSAVLRFALGARPGWAAVSTLEGLFYLDPFDASTPAGSMRASRTPDAAQEKYVDVKWGADGQVLYAGGPSGRVDTYVLE